MLLNSEILGIPRRWQDIYVIALCPTLLYALLVARELSTHLFLPHFLSLCVFQRYSSYDLPYFNYLSLMLLKECSYMYLRGSAFVSCHL